MQSRHLLAIMAAALALGAALGIFSLRSDTVVVRLTTSHGPIEMQMWPDIAPRHVAQITRLVKAGLYDGSVVFRLEKDFVAQFGGDYARPAPPTPEQRALITQIPAEFNAIEHIRGILSMARYDDPNSATASFSILLGRAAHLDGKYTVFGRISPDSDETLRRIEAVGVKPGTNQPAAAIVVTKAELL